MDINAFLKELEDYITIEANNGDYYVDGYVESGGLADIINKHFPERQFKDYGTYYHWYPRAKSSLLWFADVYNEAIVQQLARTTGFALIKPTQPTNDDGTVTFKVRPVKKDDES